MALEGLMKADDKIYADLVTSKNDKIKQVCSAIFIKTDGPLYYLSCPNEKCKKKVIDES